MKEEFVLTAGAQPGSKEQRAAVGKSLAEQSKTRKNVLLLKKGGDLEFSICQF